MFINILTIYSINLFGFSLNSTLFADHLDAFVGATTQQVTIVGLESAASSFSVVRFVRVSERVRSAAAFLACSTSFHWAAGRSIEPI